MCERRGEECVDDVWWEKFDRNPVWNDVPFFCRNEWANDIALDIAVGFYTKAMSVRCPLEMSVEFTAGVSRIMAEWITDFRVRPENSYPLRPKCMLTSDKEIRKLMIFFHYLGELFYFVNRFILFFQSISFID